MGLCVYPVCHKETPEAPCARWTTTYTNIMPVSVLVTEAILMLLRPVFWQRQGRVTAMILDGLPSVCKHTEVNQQRYLLGYRIFPQLNVSKQFLNTPFQICSSWLSHFSYCRSQCWQTSEAEDFAQPCTEIDDVGQTLPSSAISIWQKHSSEQFGFLFGGGQRWTFSIYFAPLVLLYIELITSPAECQFSERI